MPTVQAVDLHLVVGEALGRMGKATSSRQITAAAESMAPLPPIIPPRKPVAGVAANGVAAADTEEPVDAAATLDDEVVAAASAGGSLLKYVLKKASLVLKCTMLMQGRLLRIVRGITGFTPVHRRLHASRQAGRRGLALVDHESGGAGLYTCTPSGKLGNLFALFSFSPHPWQTPEMLEVANDIQSALLKLLADSNEVMTE